MSWADRWMEMATLVSTWSKDESRKTGAVIVGPREALISIGWNGFPRRIDDNVQERKDRPEPKYKWTEHAERNAIYVASLGTSTLGSTMYLSWYPCADCARAIIQAGIGRLVCLEPNWKDKVWEEDFAIVKTMLWEAHIDVVFHGRYEEEPK